jgi:hypothetical protein
MNQPWPTDLPLPLTTRAHESDRRTLRAASDEGVLVRLRRGSYVDSAGWAGLRRDEGGRLVIREVASRRPSELLVSHTSAAVLWGLPLVGRRIDRVDSLRFTVNGGRSEATIRAHRSGIPCTPEQLDGIWVTPVLRTLIDVALTEPLVTSVAAIDAAVSRGLVDPEALEAELAHHGRARGLVLARSALVVASPGSRSPLESLSAVRMFEGHLVRPEQQVPFPSTWGSGYEVDFRWRLRALRLLGEADGDEKYALHGTGSTWEAVRAEKEREDDLRAQGNDVVRWRWDEAWGPGALCRKLEARGVPLGRPW